MSLNRKMKNSHRGNNQHNYLIDYIKAIGVIGVMLVHLYKPIPYLTCVITNFYIPVFFICSSFTTPQNSFISLRKKAIRLLIPYILYWFVYIMGCLGVYNLFIMDLWGFLYSRYKINECVLQSLYIGPTWFLTAMFLVFVGYKFFNLIQVSLFYKFLITMVLGLFFAYLSPIQLPWSLENCLMFLSYVYVGQFFCSIVQYRCKSWLLFLICLFYLLLSQYNGCVNLSLSFYGKNLFLTYILPLLAFYGLYQIFKFLNLQERVFILHKFVSFIGQNSLSIFLSHMLFYAFFQFLLTTIFSSTAFFKDAHYLIQGTIVVLTILLTVLTCQWQNRKITTIESYILKNDSTRK